jgi:hypothetical protein
MSADVRGLSVLAYANGFTQWHYRCPGVLAQLDAEQYFDVFADMIAAGDVVLVSAHDGFAMLYVMPPINGSVGGGPRLVRTVSYRAPAKHVSETPLPDKATPAEDDSLWHEAAASFAGYLDDRCSP